MYEQYNIYGINISMLHYSNISMKTNNISKLYIATDITCSFNMHIIDIMYAKQINETKTKLTDNDPKKHPLKYFVFLHFYKSAHLACPTLYSEYHYIIIFKHYIRIRYKYLYNKINNASYFNHEKHCTIPFH